MTGDGSAVESGAWLYDDAGTGGSLSLDEVFGLLRSERRRAVLRHLDGTDGPVSLDDLVSCVEARHGDVGFEAGRRDEVAVSLHQVHLPRLERAGVVEYDAAAKTVRLCQGFPTLFAHLYFEPE